mgnify:CR=1 FL=1
MKRQGTIVSVFLLTFFLFSFVIQAQLPMPRPGKIIGTVTNTSNEPLPGTVIQVKTNSRTIQTLTADAQGKFELGLPPGDYQLSFQLLGYENLTTSVDLKEGATVDASVQLKSKSISFDEVVVSATRAQQRTPIPHQEINAKEIAKINNGQDLPILLDQATSVVTTSDAGGGIGYTGLRIRGSDPSRVNVTINGIPVNDAESQGVFWVNMPDFASSVSSVQIQRGVGTSTNGAGAFGATVNLNTFDTRPEAYGIYSGAVGSFNTQKHTAEFGTGLIDDKYYVDGRLSQIRSDGYIDRASSNLRSYYLSAGRITDKSHLKFITFSGQERTYQAWYGVPQSQIDAGNRTYNPYDYDNQVDNYGQTHYQLHYMQELNSKIQFTSALHYTQGEGYFEEYKGDRYNQDIFTSPESFSDYGLSNVIIGNDTLTETNLIQRRWLDNDFYGGVFSLQYNQNKLSATLGGGLHIYEGLHFGEVIWAQYASNGELGHEWYTGDSRKLDFNVYARANYDITNKINAFADLQYRKVNYTTEGVDNDLSIYDVDDNLDFFNPKAGIYADISDHDAVYGSFSVGNREPSRNDYIDRAQGVGKPTHETLYDYELGYKRKMKKYQAGVNLYYMDYQNQLVLTGEVNDVGSAIRQNVAESYRAGVELEYAYQPVKWFKWMANATFSQNKIDSYTQKIYSWDTDNYPEAEEIEYTNTDIAFSPNVIAANTFEGTFRGFLRKGKAEDQLQVALISKYVGDQYLDNSQSDLRKLDAYFVNDVRFNYTIKNTFAKEIGINLLVRNVLSELYSANGWVYRFRHPDQAWGPATAYDIYAQPDTELNTGDGNDVHYFEQGLFPQAEINFLLGLTVKF